LIGDLGKKPAPVADPGDALESSFLQSFERSFFCHR